MRGQVIMSNTATNTPYDVMTTLLRLRRDHQYCVQELGGFYPGVLADSTGMFQPHVGVVTFVRQDHRSAFRDLDATAREKRVLVECLPGDGIAILNADDERVLEMRSRTNANVITYGLSPEAIVRGEQPEFGWPDPLSLTVCYDGQKVLVETQLLGEHWVYPALAAVATAVAEGVQIEDAARAIGSVRPVEQRLSERRMPDGVTFILDTWKAPLYSFPISLRVLETADAKRRIAVIGTISDMAISASKAYRRVARQALEAADVVIFVGRWAQSAIKGRPPGCENRLMGFENIYELRGFLHGYLTSGDLVLLKGSITADHLERIVWDWESEFACWRLKCGKLLSCRDCRLSRTPFIPGG